MTSFENSEGNNNKLEKSKIQDIKDIVDQQFATLSSDIVSINEPKQNPLQNFFLDEINLMKKLLNIIRADMDMSFFEDNEVVSLNPIIIIF